MGLFAARPRHQLVSFTQSTMALPNLRGMPSIPPPAPPSVTNDHSNLRILAHVRGGTSAVARDVLQVVSGTDGDGGRGKVLMGVLQLGIRRELPCHFAAGCEAACYWRVGAAVSVSVLDGGFDAQ